MLAFFCIMLFVLDCSIFGGGHYIAIGPLTPRMIFAFLALLLSIPILFIRRKQLLRNPLILTVLLFAVYMGICAIRGYYAQNRLNVLLSDVKGFLWLFLVPVIMVNVTTKRQFSRLLDCVVIGAAIQSILVLVINVTCVLIPNGITIWYDYLIDTQIGNVNYISNAIFRIFMKSVPYTVVALAIVVFRQIQHRQIKKQYLLLAILYLNALLFSYTRSVYGCLLVVAVVGAAGILFLYRKYFRRFCKFTIIALFLTCSFLFVQEFAFRASYVNFAFARTFGAQPTVSLAVSIREKLESPHVDFNDPNVDTEIEQPDDLEQEQEYIDITEASDDIRSKTQAELLEIISRNPIFGSGLGASAPSRDNGLDEYFYLDMLARTGIIGLILYVLPFVYICVFMWKRRNTLSSYPFVVAQLSGMVGFWAITWFNPWMNAVLGITNYALCFALPNLLKDFESNN